jgi:hypothetical protein
MNETWLQIAAVVLSNFSIILWFRMESRADWRHMDAKMEAKLDAMQKSTADIIQGIREDMKDFHNRLIEIEVKSKILNKD